MLFDLGIQPAYHSARGAMYCADSLEMLAKLPDESVNLVMTSPPFALQRKKEYGNKDQHEYVEWLTAFGKLVFQKLKPDGSFVLDYGLVVQQDGMTEGGCQQGVGGIQFAHEKAAGSTGGVLYPGETSVRA